MRRGIVALLLALATGSASADARYDEISACMRANVPDAVRAQRFTMSTTDVAGTRTLKGEIYARREQGRLRLSLRVKDPPDLRGSAYLLRESDGTREDDIYLSLPAFPNRIKRITGAQAGQSLLSSDFTYADIKHIQNALNTGAGAVEKTEGGADVIAINSKSGGPYTLTRLWVDQKNCMTLRGEFYQGNVLVKKLKNDDVKQSGRYWYAGKVRMEDLTRGTHSEILVEDLKSVPDDKISARYFNVNTFYEGN